MRGRNQISRKRQKEIEKIIKLDAEDILSHQVFDVEFIDSLAKSATMDHILRSQVPTNLTTHEEIECYILFLSDFVAAELTKFLRKETQSYFRKLFHQRSRKRKAG